MERGLIDKKLGSQKLPILCSSSYATPKNYLQLNRNGQNEDPWLSYTDHGTSTMMYGENSKFRYIEILLVNFSLSGSKCAHVVCPGYGGHSENILLDGMNVWIYPPQ